MTAASTRGGCNLLSRVACFRHTRHTAEREKESDVHKAVPKRHAGEGDQECPVLETRELRP